MKKLTVFLCSLALFFSLAGIAGATPIHFNVDGNGSSVDLDNTFNIGGDLLAGLADDLGSVDFTLGDTGSFSFDFIKFEAPKTGFGLFDINATLAFDTPILSANYSGGGGWGSIRNVWGGRISGGVLSWNNPTHSFNVDGNVVSLALAQGITIVPGNSTFLRATVTNSGGGTASVPEPSTILLMGAGLLGLVAVGRRKFNR